MQEVVELVVFALIALLVGTGLVWVSGWLLGLVGTVLTWFAGLVWSLLRFLVPIAVVAGLVYLLVQFLSRSGEKVARGPQTQPPTPPSPWTMSKDGPGETAPAEPAPAADVGQASEANVETTPATVADVDPSASPAGDADESPREEGSGEVDDENERPTT